MTPLKASEFLPASRQLAGNGIHNLAKRDMPVLDQVPEVVKITGLVSGPVEEGHDFLGGDLGERVDADTRVFWQVLVFGISPKHRALLNREDDLLLDGDVHLHLFSRRATG